MPCHLHCTVLSLVILFILFFSYYQSIVVTQDVARTPYNASRPPQPCFAIHSCRTRYWPVEWTRRSTSIKPPEYLQVAPPPLMDALGCPVRPMMPRLEGSQAPQPL